ncbi:DEAD/DEAH box helicase [Streptomyces rectiverticillatus]|nr:DEAD/DEAH box helicase [Streptomyces rectiverticillatus]
MPGRWPDRLPKPTALRAAHTRRVHQEGSARGTCARAKAVVPRHPASPGRTVLRRGPYDLVRPPSPPSAAASHRRGKILSTPSNPSTFRDLGILPETAEALEAVGIVHPFPIQEMTLPVALSGSDVIGQAKTGTGKTLGFGLPLLERVVVPADVEAGRAKPEQLTDAPQALVVVPTRELCQQVTNDLLTAGKVRNVRVQAIYGGRAYEPQVEALKKGVDVIVGTPGRLLDLAGQKKLSLAHVKALVLDEADEMLDLGFLPDVERIITMLPAKRQTMLFSATMPGAVISLARRYMSQPTHIRATSPDDEGQTHANIAQHIFRAHNMDKPEMVARILQAEGRNRAMIFCRTKRTAADIADQLLRRGFASGAVHGDLGQGAREQALRAFRNGKVDVLVCTDVAARGIDVDDVTHVINYQSPEDEKTYLHRIGRTGRAGKSGTAVTLVDWDDIPRWKLINKALELPFDEPEETYSTSPHLYEVLGIPAGTKGILPRSERTRAGLAAEEIEDLGETGGRSARGGRGGDRDRGRDRDRDRGPRQESEERPARTRTPRQRRRTRGGAVLGAETAAAPAAAAAPVTESAPATPSKPRRRRRTRGGAGSAAAVTPAATETVVTTEAVAPAETAVAAPAVEVPAQPRRRRTRAAKPEAAAAVVTAETMPAEAAPVVPVQETQEQAEAEPARRTRAKKAAAAPVAEVVAEAEAVAVTEAPAEVKPKRTRAKKAAAAPAEVAAEATEVVETVEAKPKRTRAKKAAAPVAEPAVEAEAEVKPKRTRKAAAPKADATETAEVKPKRTRAKKAAAAPAEVAAEATEVVETVEAKPKRTRAKKAAAPVAEPAVEAEAEVKPKRTRTTKKAAAAVEPVAEAATEVAEKPKRTRKTAAAKKAEAEAAVDTAEAAEVKPKRTRTTKKAAAAVAEPVADAEAKPKRTRKAAAPKADATEAVAEVKPKRTRKAAAPKAKAEAGTDA